MGVTSSGPSIVSKVDGTQLIGQQLAANSLPVVLASDQPGITADTAAKATAAAPSYAEGTENSLSQTLTGDLRVVAKTAASQTATNKSFITDGADHVVIAANAARLGYLIENPMSATLNANHDNIVIRLGAVAAVDGTSFEITPGGFFPPQNAPLYVGDVHVLGPTGIKCPAVEFAA